MKLLQILILALFLIGATAPLYATQPIDNRAISSSENIIKAESEYTKHKQNYSLSGIKTKAFRGISTFFQKVTAKIMPKQYSKMKSKANGDGSTAALIGLIMGAVAILGIFVPFLRLIGFLFAPASIIFSSIALSRIKRSGGNKGKWQAIIGLILGSLATIFLILLLGAILFY